MPSSSENIRWKVFIGLLYDSMEESEDLRESDLFHMGALLSMITQ